MAPTLLIFRGMTPVIFFSVALVLYVCSFPLAIRYILKNEDTYQGQKMIPNSVKQISLNQANLKKINPTLTLVKTN